MAMPLYYVCTPEFAHHARPLAGAFDLRIETPQEVVRVARPGESCVFFTEQFPCYREPCFELKARGCPTLYAVDGILEWRHSWDPRTDDSACPWNMRPVISDKVACIGRSQARTLESWGNLGKCEVVGVPRFDRLRERRPRARPVGEPLRVLVLTARSPGFNAAQMALTKRSLLDAKRWFDDHPRLGSVPLAPVWRITNGLDAEIGVHSQLADTTGQDLATVLETVDAVIATPSTAMLEAMLHGLPVALLDYHNRPHYVPAAWRITAQEQFEDVLADLVCPPAPRMLYQQSILHDALECHAPATPRMVELIERMHAIARQCLARGEPLSFPRRILSDPQDGHHLAEPGYDHSHLFPLRTLLAEAGCPLPVAEAAEPDRYERLAVAPGDDRDQPANNGAPSLNDLDLSIQASSCSSRGLLQEIETRRQAEIALRRELVDTQRQLRTWQRRALPARLARLGTKVRRILGLARPDRQTQREPNHQRWAA
jgi:hypothetical protein